MKLVSVTISGFRGYRELTKIAFRNISVLAGKNDAGKTTIFDALGLFLEGGRPDLTDFSVNGGDEIVITCEFDSLPPSVLLDAAVVTTFADEELLSENGTLIITKRFVPKKAAPSVSVNAMHPSVEGQKHIIELKHADLKALAAKLGVLEVNDKRVSSEFRRAIWDKLSQDAQAGFAVSEVALNADDGKQVASSLENYYPRFHLFRSDRAGVESDELAQDPAKAVVKSVLDRHAEELSRLTTEIQSEITEQLLAVVGKLQNVAPELASGLAPINIEPSWHKAFSALQFVDENQVSLAKRGSGTRRLVLLSFFRAEAERATPKDNEWQRGVIIAVEEPETALHPDLQREAVASLIEVAQTDGRQVFLTTHSSNLIRYLPIESLNYADQSSGHVAWRSTSTDDSATVLGLLDKAMGTFTDHNVRCFILVEGANDIGGLLNFSDNLSKIDASYPNLRQLEAAGMVCFVPIGGCGAAALWESRLSPFRRPEIHLLDSDRDSLTAPLSKSVSDYQKRYLSEDPSTSSVVIWDCRELENFLTKESVTERLAIVGQEFADAFAASVEPLDWKYADIPALVSSASKIAGNKYVWNSSTAKKELVQCFSHPSVASSAIEEGSSNQLLGLLNFVSTHTTLNSGRSTSRGA